MLKPLLFMLGLVAGCGVAQSQALRMPQNAIAPQDIPSEAWYTVPDARGVQVVNIDCGSGLFDPYEIVVKANIPVELLVRTSEPSQEFVSGFMAAQAIGRKPTPFRFTPNALGHLPLLCRTLGQPDSPKAPGIKRGVLTVVQSYGKPQ